MSPLTKLAALVIALTAGLGAVWYADRATRDLPAKNALPSGTFLAVTLDADALKKSPALSQLLGGGDAFGVKSLEEPCGFDPIARVREVAIAVPEEGETGDFGVALRIDATGEELARCAERVGEKKGKRASFAKQGEYYVVDEAVPGGRRVAYRPVREGAGVLRVALPGWLAKMQRALDGVGPRVDADRVHAQIRGALARHGPLSISLSAALPKSVRERLRRELEVEARVRGARALRRDARVARAPALLALARPRRPPRRGAVHRLVHGRGPRGDPRRERARQRRRPRARGPPRDGGAERPRFVRRRRSAPEARPPRAAAGRGHPWA